MIIQISAQIYPCWCTITLYKPIFSRPRLALTLLHIYIFYDSWPTPQWLSKFYSLHPIACSCSLHPSLDCVGVNNDNTPLPGWGYCLPTLSMCDKWGKEITPFLCHFFVKRRRRERERTGQRQGRQRNQYLSNFGPKISVWMHYHIIQTNYSAASSLLV